MLSLYRAWLGPSPCVARPAPPPGAHRPVPRRAKAPSPQRDTPPPPSPSSTTSSELDVERIEPEEPKHPSNTVLDIASCDGPVRFSRVLNTAWQENSERNWACRHRKQRATMHYYPCKTCGCKFPSYYFVHKHRKRCHGEDTPVNLAVETQNLNEPQCRTSETQGRVSEMPSRVSEIQSRVSEIQSRVSETQSRVSEAQNRSELNEPEPSTSHAAI